MSLDVYLSAVVETNVFHKNITHNLNVMAKNCILDNGKNLYQYLWRPDEIEVTQAYQLIAPLKEGLQKLEDKREFFENFNPSNGWGNYKNLVEFVREYLRVCIEYPAGKIEISR